VAAEETAAALAIALPEDHALSDEHLETLPCTLMSRALVEGAELAEMDWDTYRSDRKDRSVRSDRRCVHPG